MKDKPKVDKKLHNRQRNRKKHRIEMKDEPPEIDNGFFDGCDKKVTQVK